MKEGTLKIFYTIKEVAKLVGEPESTLRYWEEEFPEEITPSRNDRKIRSYTENDINNIRTIQYFIRDHGLTLDGTRKKLKNNKESAVKQAKIVFKLRNIRSELKSLADAMTHVANE